MSDYQVLCYSRKPLEDGVYGEKIANSMHLALSVDGGQFQALHHNYGVLFTKAVEKDNGALDSRSLKSPWIFETKNGGYGITAIRVMSDGSDDLLAKGSILMFSSDDLLQYIELPLISLSSNFINDVLCYYDKNKKTYVLRWLENDKECYEACFSDIKNIDIYDKTRILDFYQGINLPNDDKIEKIEGIIKRNCISVPESVGKRLALKLNPPVNTCIELPQNITVSSKKELDDVKVKAIYSDGTESTKKIDWYADDINWEKPGTYEMKGRVHQDQFTFPIAWNRADPCIGKWKGKYYFIATNDADHNHTLYIREADSIPALVTAQEILLLDSETYPHVGNLLWAPEFHIIKDRLYIFHAATPEKFEDEQSHVMVLSENGNPMIKEDWSEPKRVVKKDGSPLFDVGITLDMTVLKQNGKYFAAWSQRQFVPDDLGAWICFAEIDPDEPWKLLSDPITLSKPDYSWDNNHTYVDEGPFALITDKKIFLTFSGAAVDSTYTVGLLTADINAELLNPSSWVKCNYPLMTSLCVEGEFGTGHNAYVTDDDGIIWNTYHARRGINGERSSGIRRVHFDIDGYPVLDLTEEKDLAPELTNVSVKITVH